MGFFSNKCSKSGVSIPAGNTGLPDEASTVVVLRPNGNKYEGLYDGYGRILGEYGQELLDVSDDMISNTLKWVRKDYYRGETYQELSLAENCDHQGYFYDEHEINEIVNSLRHNARDFIEGAN